MYLFGIYSHRFEFVKLLGKNSLDPDPDPYLKKNVDPDPY